MPPTNSTRNWVHSDRQPSFSKQTALPLLAVNQRQYRVCRKRLSRTDHLVVYDGDGTASRPLLSVRRHASLRSSSKTLAHVTPLGSAAAEYSYVVEGSYGRRACAVRDARGGGAAVVAEVRRKESVGDDVFRLVADRHGPCHRAGRDVRRRQWLGAVPAAKDMVRVAAVQAPKDTHVYRPL